MSSTLKMAEAAGGCSVILVMFILSTSFWSFLFYLVYDHLLPIWVDNLPTISFPIYIVAGLVLGIVVKIFKK